MTTMLLSLGVLLVLMLALLVKPVLYRSKSNLQKRLEQLFDLTQFTFTKRFQVRITIRNLSNKFDSTGETIICFCQAPTLVRSCNHQSSYMFSIFSSAYDFLKSYDLKVVNVSTGLYGIIAKFLREHSRRNFEYTIPLKISYDRSALRKLRRATGFVSSATGSAQRATQKKLQVLWAYTPARS